MKNARSGKIFNDRDTLSFTLDFQPLDSKQSRSKEITIYLYSLDLKPIECFTSSIKAGNYFQCDPKTILRYAHSGATLKYECFLSLVELSISNLIPPQFEFTII